jgi:hypothetical protein
MGYSTYREIGCLGGRQRGEQRRMWRIVYTLCLSEALGYASRGAHKIDLVP